jgi:hypothetical protein
VIPNAVTAGTDAVLDLTGTNVNLAVSGLRVGFGTSDIVVRHIWLLSAQHVRILISVAPEAALGQTTVTLSAGLQLVEGPLSLQINAHTQLPWVQSSGTLPGSLPSGLMVPYLIVLPIENVSTRVSGADFTAAMATADGDVPLGVLAFMGGELIVNLPANLTPGPLSLKIAFDGTVLAPVVVDVRAPAPIILQASDPTTGSAYVGTAPAIPGNPVSLMVSNLAEGLAPVDLSSLIVSVNGIAQTVTSAVLQTTGSNQYSVQFLLDSQTQLPAGSSSLPVTLTAGSRFSAAFALPVSAPVAQPSN